MTLLIRALLCILVVMTGACIEPPDAAKEGSDPVTPTPREPTPKPPVLTEPEEPEPVQPEDPQPPEDPEPGPSPEPDPVAACEAGEPCVDVFPHTIMDTTEGGTRSWGRYACDPDVDESGPERVYRVVVPHAGFLSVRVSGEPDEVDIDVHLLGAQDPEACLDRGHKTTGSWLEPGVYWLAADTWVDEAGTEYAGTYTLSFNLTRPEDLSAHGMREEVATEGLRALSHAWGLGETRRLEYALTDFSIHSSLRRQWVVDLGTGALLYHLHTAHGEASVEGEDLGMASIFSNTPGSHQSSLGLMRTAETYVGDFGYSMRLDGLEDGFNDAVRRRDIVVHPWNGNIESIIDERGWVVPSWGCATLEPTISKEVIDTLSDGALMFFWYPDPAWREGSTYLK